MPEPLLNVLKILLLLLLYLFFLRVLRAVWAEVNVARQPATTVPGTPKRTRGRTPRKARTRQPPQLVVVEPEGLAGSSFALGDELTVGRAAGCQITLDDTFVSQLHARLFTRDGQLFVEDLGSTNGTYLNRRKVAGPMVMSMGDRLQIGSTVMELR